MEQQPPSPKPWEVSDEEAVELCRDWMIYLGALDTVASVGETREVCDLYSAQYVAWVNNQRGNLDVDVVEKAATLASADGRRPLIFVSGGVVPMARMRGDGLGVALFRFGAHSGVLDGANTLGRQLCATGMASA